jgi:hypothetical protein
LHHSSEASQQQEKGGTRHDGISPKRRAGRSRNVAERCGATRAIGRFERAITTRFSGGYRPLVGAPHSSVDPGVVRQRVWDSDPSRARGGLRARFVLRLRFRDTTMDSLDRMRLYERLCRHLPGARCECADRERIVLLLRQSSAGILAGKVVAQPAHILARHGVADRQPGQDEDAGFRCHGDSGGRGRIRILRPTLSRHQSVSGNVRREVAVSPAVRLAPLREQEEAAQAGLGDLPLPAQQGFMVEQSLPEEAGTRHTK